MKEEDPDCSICNISHHKVYPSGSGKSMGMLLDF